MNVETSAPISNTATTKVESSSANSNATNSIKDGNSFKDELKNVESTKNKSVETTKKSENTKTTETNNKKVEENNKSTKAQTETKSLKEVDEKGMKNALQDKLSFINKKKDNEELYASLSELNEKIDAINNLKNDKIGLLTATIEKNQYLDKDLTEKSDLCKTISMDEADANFFLNLVQNEPMNAQNIQAITQNNTQFTDIKAEATQKIIAVSQTLIDCLNESMKTNKPFRIDFDNNVAVIMKVDANGVLSANFIPGSAAVENYLRNNIGLLKQSFDEQDLKYNELSYSSRENNQQRRQQKEQENKEN